MNARDFYTVVGERNHLRLESRVLEEIIQNAVARGQRRLRVDARGQHGIGGRLWSAGKAPVELRIEGAVGQRVGSMGFPGTYIEIMGPAADDVGWLNAGAEIVVHGHATNGVANAMAQGKVYVGGNIGARGMTMTKHNPRFDPPELWVLGSVGDYFAEFMAGGIAVICGHDPQDPESVLGHRPCVGMVAGKIFFRGLHKGFSQADARLAPIDEENWNWLVRNLRVFLNKIGRVELLSILSDPASWQLLTARRPHEKQARLRRSVHDFAGEVWERELGAGGLVGDLLPPGKGTIPLIASGELRRYVPVWENKKHLPPCQTGCPTGMPVQQRWRLIREGRVDEAVDLALAYTPFPATVCGYLCPHLCMQGCTRQMAGMAPVDVSRLGKASQVARLPEMPPLTGRRIGVMGGGPAGISVAWQLRLQGHEAVVYDMETQLGGKITSTVPGSRIPREVIEFELTRVREVIPHVRLQQRLGREEVEQLVWDYDFLVLAAGAVKPRTLNVPGKERMVHASEFLRKAKSGETSVGEKVVIIGAGNVGCDAATEAHRLGAKQITLIDVQEPASFGEERKAAEALGVKFLWPCYTHEITVLGVVLTTGQVLPADTVILSIGDVPDLELVPATVATKAGYVLVNEDFQTSDPRIFAVGDMVKPGLLTDAIGAGRKAAAAIGDILAGRRGIKNAMGVMDRSRIRLEYFDPRKTAFGSLEESAAACASCGVCRDCGVCETLCPQGAISRRDDGPDGFEMRVDPDKCIGCGFCAGVCPCGIWNLVENEPLA